MVKQSVLRVRPPAVEIAARYSAYYGVSLRGRAYLTMVPVEWTRRSDGLRLTQHSILGVCVYIEGGQGLERFFFTWRAIMAAAPPDVKKWMIALGQCGGTT